MRAEPLTSALRAPPARCRKAIACAVTASTPCTTRDRPSGLGPDPMSARATTSGSSTATSASRLPSRDAARNASTSSHWRSSGTSAEAVAPRSLRRARLASWRVASVERWTTGPIWSNGSPNVSCRTNARRSAGLRVSRTMSIASPTESASRASCSGSTPSGLETTGSGMATSRASSIGSSRLEARVRRRSRQSRATIVVTVRGRVSGEPGTAPVAVIEIKGRRFVIGAYGDVQWIRNLRAAGEGDLQIKGETLHVTARELDLAAAATFYGVTLPGYIAEFPWFGRAFAKVFFRLIGPELADDPERAAALHPVFELRG